MLDGGAVRALGEHGGAGRVVGAPGVGAYQPFAHQVLAGVAQEGGVLGVGVPDVELVQVHMVGVEAAQGRGQGAAQVFRGVVAAVGGPRPLVEEVAPFGGDDHVGPALAEGPAQHAFAVPGAVVVGRVEEGDAQVEGVPHRPYRLLVVDLPPAQRPPVGRLPLPADRPAAEAQGAHLDAAASQCACGVHARGRYELESTRRQDPRSALFQAWPVSKREILPSSSTVKLHRVRISPQVSLL